MCTILEYTSILYNNTLMHIPPNVLRRNSRNSEQQLICRAMRVNCLSLCGMDDQLKAETNDELVTTSFKYLRQIKDRK